MLKVHTYIYIFFNPVSSAALVELDHIKQCQHMSCLPTMTPLQPSTAAAQSGRPPVRGSLVRSLTPAVYMLKCP